MKHLYCCFKYLFFLFFWGCLGFCISTKTQAQSQYVDSLFNQIKSSPDSLKTRIYLELAHEYIGTDFRKSVAFAKTSLNFAQKTRQRNRQARALDLLGSIYGYQGDYVTALSYKIKALKIYDEVKDLKGEASLSNNIGVLYFRQKKYNEALLYYQKALKYAYVLKDSIMISTYLLNIGEVYYEEGDFDNALEYEQKAYQISLQLELYDNEAYTLGILGKIYFKKGNYTKASQLTKGALRIFKALEDPNGEAEYLLALARIFQKQNQIDSALYSAYDALELAKSAGLNDWAKEAYLTLAEINAQNQQMSEAYRYHQLYAQTKDSIYNESNARKMAQMQILYETEKKEKENELLRKNQTLQAKNLSAQQRISELLGLGGILVLVLAFFLYQSNLAQQKANKDLQVKNTEINQQKEEIEAQRDAIAHQRNEIELKNKNINASLNYASRIQNALLPIEEDIRKIIPEYFIFFQPRDVVSGDFYWIETDPREEKVIIAAIDCTGHGVPGAFMSMIADSILNHIVLDRGIWEVDKILTQMHLEVRKTLKQELNENRDGMDLALCMIDKKQNKLEFAGAHNPLIIVQDGKMQKVRGDKFGVGGLQLEKDRIFTKHCFDLSLPTSFYIFTDGFQDQFGGTNKKKFLPRNLANLLLEVHQLPTNIQKQLLQKTLNNWMGSNNEQIDDILVIGVKCA